LLPEKEKFEKLMQKSGVSNDSTIVITSKGQAVVFG
jgi:3-mercaptopyruvate sulfurtransferase SseA